MAGGASTEPSCQGLGRHPGQAHQLLEAAGAYFGFVPAWPGAARAEPDWAFVRHVRSVPQARLGRRPSCCGPRFAGSSDNGIGLGL
jgi:hypothetical protein